MSKKLTLVQVNMIMNALLTLSSVIFPVITLPYVTRILGADGVGRVYFASSVIAGLAMFAELGIPVYGIRACARVRDDRAELSRTVREILMINLMTCAAAYLLLFIMLDAVSRMAAERTLLLIMSSTILLNCIGAEWMFKALEKYKYITVRSIIFKIIAMITMFIVVRRAEDYVIYGCITIFAVSASNIMNLFTIHGYADLRPKGRHDLKRHLPGMLMLFALAAATTVYTNLDLAILGFIRGDAEAGLYGVAVRIKLVIVSLVTSVSAVLLPRNSYYYENDHKKEFYRLLNTTLKIVIAVSVPTVVFFMLFARESILMLAGGGFTGAVMPMIIIMPSVTFIGVSNIIGIQMLVPSGRENIVVRAALTGAAIDLILNLILIPDHGAAGASAATLAAEICVMGCMLYEVRDTASELFRDVSTGRIIIASAVSAVGGMLIKNAGFQPLLTIITSAIIYFGMYTLIIFITEKRRRV